MATWWEQSNPYQKSWTQYLPQGMGEGVGMPASGKHPAQRPTHSNLPAPAPGAPNPLTAQYQPNEGTDEYLGWIGLDGPQRDEVSTWDTPWRNAYLKALGTGDKMIYFNGTEQRGFDVAKQVEQMYRDMFNQANANREQDYRITPYATNRIY